MTSVAHRPKVVFFQFRYLDSVTRFQLIHRDEHVRCLEQFFDVTVISEDCDYQQVCDSVEPDLAIFETGLEILGTRRLKITNVRSGSAIPKIALLNSDGCSELRPAIMSDIDHWGIDTLFSISLVSADYLREVVGRLYVWPNFVDPMIYRDYRQQKLIPVLLTGSMGPRYPWRNAINQQILGHVPTFWYPHLGYTANSRGGEMIVGEAYARLLNSSRIAPACGSVSRELVRKHLEIPGSMSCLLTEKSRAVEAAGFVDLVNCVFATPPDVLDKIGYLLSHENKLAEITRAGHDLVHSRHTMSHRSQILQWFDLNRSRRAHETIVQPDPFGPLALADRSNAGAGIRMWSSGAQGVHLHECELGDRLLAQGDPDGAERAFRRCLNYLSEFPEAKFKTALCRLWAGDPKGALSWIAQPLRTSLVRYGAEDPDPVEWALFVFILVCLNRLREAARRASQFPGLRHLELDRVRWLVECLRPTTPLDSPFPSACESPRVSIHEIPTLDPAHWIRDRSSILRRCGRERFADVVSGKTRGLSRNSVWASLKNKVATIACSVPLSLRPKSEQATLTGLDHPELWAALSRRARHAIRAQVPISPLLKRLRRPALGKADVTVRVTKENEQPCARSRWHPSA